MKRCMKVLLATLLVVSVAVSAFAFTGIFSSAQALAKGVNAAFTGADNDWVTLSGTTIQDSALKFTIYNYSEDTIVITKLENTGNNIKYTGWTTGMLLESNGITNIGISGTTANNAVLRVTMTYYVQGNPESTAETCSAYIYCSTSQGYSSLTNNSYIKSGSVIPWDHPGRLGVDTTQVFYPVSAGSSVAYSDTESGEQRYAVMTINLYVDTSLYKTWDSLNAKINYANGTIRDHAYWDKITLSQTSNTGSVEVNGFGVNKDSKSLTSEFDSDSKEGFMVQVGQSENVDIPITGQIASEASSSVNIKFRGYGQTGGIYGVLSSKTKDLNPEWKITLYSYDKDALRERLKEYAGYGLNQGSYKSGWDTYETALKNAYTVLGSNNVTASQVASAKTAVENAYAGLVRYAVVITNHYYYEGTNDQNPVLITKKFETQVTNNANHTLEWLTNGTYPQYPFNRSNKGATTEKMIAVGEDSNYTEVVNQYYWNVDTSALEAAIATQEAMSNKDEADNPIYEETSWNNYLRAGSDARDAFDNKALFQDDINAATKALNNAKAALVKLDIDVEWLTEGIEWATCIVDSNYEDDYGHGWVTEDLFASPHAQSLYANFQSAYNEAVEVTNNPDYTKAQVDRVCVALWQAISDLRTVDNSTMGILVVDSARHADIDQYGWYKSLLDQHKESNGLRVVYNDILDNTSGEYRLNEEAFTADSWYALQDALYGDFAEGNYCCAATEEAYPAVINGEEGELNVPAYSMINNIWFLASQADYNACRDNLISKVYNLEWEVDPSALVDAYEAASEYDLSLYTQKTAAVLEEKLAEARAKLDKLDAEPQIYGDAEAVTNSVIAQTVEDLNAAVAGLELKPILEPSSQDIEFIPGEDSTIYGEAIGQTVEDALADLNIIHDSESVVVKIFDATDKEMALTSKLGTGYKVKLMSDDGDVYETHTYVIKGDVIGDAQIGTNDFGLVYDYAFNEDSLEGYFLEAADVNQDGVVDLTDAVIIQRIIYS